jgi:hypothetical protein
VTSSLTFSASALNDTGTVGTWSPFTTASLNANGSNPKSMIAGYRIITDDTPGQKLAFTYSSPVRTKRPWRRIDHVARKTERSSALADEHTDDISVDSVRRSLLSENDPYITSSRLFHAFDG